ncbi:MAG: hypothetical protein BWK77_03585, partial [Verrucomicrobia bacterium A1]
MVAGFAPALLLCVELALRLGGFEHTVRRKRLWIPSVFMEWGTSSVAIPTLLTPGQYLFKAQPNTPLTGPHGFRAPEPPVEKRPGTTRVAFLGGSTTQGGYYSYPQRAITILNDALGSNRFEAINWACSSYTTFQSRRVFDAEVATWRPDIVMIYHGWNDPPCSEDGYSDRENDRAARWNQRLGRVRLPDVLRSRLAQLVAMVMEKLDFSWPRPRVSPAEFRENMTHIIEACRERAIPVVVMIRPQSQASSVPAPTHADQLMRMYGARGSRDLYDRVHAVYAGIQRELVASHDHVRACDGYACMKDAQDRLARGEFPDGMEIFQPDALHLSSFGEQLLAESVAQALAPEQAEIIRRYLDSPAYCVRLAEQALEGLLLTDAHYHVQQALARDPNANVGHIVSGIESNREFTTLWDQGRCLTPGEFEWKLGKLKRCLEFRPSDIGVCGQLYGLCILNDRPDLAARGIEPFEPANMDRLAFWLLRAAHANFGAGKLPQARYYAVSLLALRPDDSMAAGVLANIDARPDSAAIAAAMHDLITDYDFQQIIEEQRIPGLSSPEASRRIAQLVIHLLQNPEDGIARNELTRLCLR